MTGKKQTKAKKRKETLLTKRGEKCALAATIADVEHGCGVKCVAHEKTRLKANESRKSGLMPCLKTILNCFALEHSAFKTKLLKMS